MKHNQFHTGQSLIEILVATGIIAVVLVGVSDLITRSMALTTFQASTNSAVNIAQNQLNYYRQLKDQRPTDFFTDPQGRFGTCVGDYDQTKYTCTIVYDTTGIANGVNMIVSVAWKDGDKNINTQLSTVLAKPTK